MSKAFETVLELEINLANEEIEKFIAKFTDNPGKALEWSFNLFERVALKQEAENLLTTIKSEKNLKSVIDYLEREILNGARFPSHSSLPTANLWEESKLVAKAFILHKLRGLL